LERESVTLLGTVTNVSLGGLFIKTPVMVAVGSDVSLTFDVGGGRVTARGNVVWTNKCSNQTSSAGLGISFSEVVSGEDLLTGYMHQYS
jgi:Tfp pilus assembly protein PilZ